MTRLTQVSDETLLAMLKQGNRRASEVLFYRYYLKIYPYILSSIKDPNLSQDLAQDVLLKLHRYSGLFKQQSKFSTWVYQITKNTLHTYFQARQRRETIESNYSEDLCEENANPEQMITGLETNHRIMSALLKLPEKMKNTFIYFMNGYSYEWISQQMRCSLGTVRSRIHRARHRLRLALA